MGDVSHQLTSVFLMARNCHWIQLPGEVIDADTTNELQTAMSVPLTLTSLSVSRQREKLTASLPTSLHRSLKADVPGCYYLTPTDCLYDRASTHNFI